MEVRQCKTDDWGTIHLLQIVDGNDFCCILEEMNDGTVIHKHRFAEAYRDGNLFGLYVEETDDMFSREAYNDPIFCQNSSYLLPCTAIKRNGFIQSVWSHERVKGYRFEKHLIRMLLHMMRDEGHYENLPKEIKEETNAKNTTKWIPAFLQR